MPRALTIARSKVAQHERAPYFIDVRRRRDEARAAGCNFWLFEDPAEPGSFVEFTEARNAETLLAARDAATAGDAGAPILFEVELD